MAHGEVRDARDGANGAVHGGLIFEVEGGGCLIEDREARLVDEHAREREPLLLAQAQLITPVAHLQSAPIISAHHQRPSSAPIISAHHQRPSAPIRGHSPSISGTSAALT